MGPRPFRKAAAVPARECTDVRSATPCLSGRHRHRLAGGAGWDLAGLRRRSELLRTLHWHPNADEWQYVIDGEVSVTLFGSHGRYRIEPENTGSRPARILIGFNAGIYETIELSQWIAANSKDVLATDFGQPPELFGKSPDRDVFIAA